MDQNKICRGRVFDFPINCFLFEDTVNLILKSLTRLNESQIVNCCSLNDVMMYGENEKIKECICRSDYTTPDGMPLVWILRWQKYKAERVYGPELMERILKESNQSLGHFFLGTNDATLRLIKKKIEKDYQNVKISGFYAPPYKEEFSEADIKLMIDKIPINTNIVWIGVGSAKQIILADKLKTKTTGKVFITVGAAFDFLAGTKPKTPRIIQRSGLEWLFRMMCEPKRLTPRYFKIMLFVWFQVNTYIKRVVFNIST